MATGESGTTPGDFLGILYFGLTGLTTIGVEWVRRKVLKSEGPKKREQEADEHCDCMRCQNAADEECK